SGLQMRWLLPLLATMAALGQPGDEAGSKVCGGCHAEIYRKYSDTSMSRSSGRVGAAASRESFDRASFIDPASRARYRISKNPAGYRMEFSRSASGVEGKRLLEWFIGSGRVGRSYLFSQDGFLFQAPVSYYAPPGKWDLSPGYQQHRFVHLTRAVGEGCLVCHASRLQPIAGTQNGFTVPPFL